MLSSLFGCRAFVFYIFLKGWNISKTNFLGVDFASSLAKFGFVRWLVRL